MVRQTKADLRRCPCGGALRALAGADFGDVLPPAAYFERGDHKEAVEWIERGLREKPDAVWANRLLSAAYFYAGRVDDAERAFAELRARLPEATVAASLMGTPWNQAVKEKFGEAFRALGLPE